MKKAIILTGRENNGRVIESYQLLIDSDYISGIYTHNSGETREDFLSDLAQRFADALSRQTSPLEIGVLNGYKIPETGKTLRIERIDEALIRDLSQKLESKLRSKLAGKAHVFTAPNPN